MPGVALEWSGYQRRNIKKEHDHCNRVETQKRTQWLLSTSKLFIAVDEDTTPSLWPSRKLSTQSSPERCARTFSVSLSFVHADRSAQVNVTGEATPNVSGALEVVIESTGAVVHSKKGGDGYVDTPEKMQKIKDAVKAIVG